jgi:hypothetical protein
MSDLKEPFPLLADVHRRRTVVPLRPNHKDSDDRRSALRPRRDWRGDSANSFRFAPVGSRSNGRVL